MLQAADHDDQFVTYEEFCHVIRDGQKADLIDGVIYMASPDTLEASKLNNFLAGLLSMYSAARNLGGTVLGSRYACRIDVFNAPEPDIVYFSPMRQHLAARLEFAGGPDVVIEIVSRDSRHRDYQVKRELYEQAGVMEYWIVDPRDRLFTALTLRECRLMEMPPIGSIFQSSAIAGFWLDVNWLFMNPLPNDYTTLQTILGGPPVSE